MSATDKELVEPERYELFAAPTYRFAPNRREVFRILGAGVLVCVTLPPSAEAQQESGGRRRAAGAGGAPATTTLGSWLHIADTGTITAYTGKVEVGQNSRTSLTQAVADELGVPAASVRLVMGDTDLTPFDAGTFGSRTTPSMAPQMRKAAAAARETLIALAAKRWQVDPASLSVASGNVMHGATNEKIGFGELAKGQEMTQTVVGADIATTPADRWKVAGTSVPKVDGRDFVTGRHKYTSDMKRDGMVYGRVLRPTAFGATLKSVDATAAKAVPGVTFVRDGDFAGVTARNSHDAARALDAIKAEWQMPTSTGSDRDLIALLRPAAGTPPSTPDVTYTLAFIAHAPLEPRAAVAEWNGDRLTVWTGTQRPFGVRGELAAAFRIPEDRVRVIVPDTGSGYGGKHTGEAAIEAARLAKAAGKPVKLVWTREEEFTWAYFRPAGVIDITAATNPDGTITAWDFTNYNSGNSGLRSPYDIPNQNATFRPSTAPLRQGSYRGLAATANHFARESHMDDLAHALKLDPLAFRLKNLKDNRLRGVLEAAAARFGWQDRKAAPGRGFGIAAGFEKGGYAAHCAEVAVDPQTGKVSVTRIVAAFECGAIVNPTHLHNQVEGATVMGLGGALFEAIHFDKGTIQNPYFSEYRVPRFRDVPPIEVVLVNRKDIPSAGAGETPIVTIAPAIGNAIFDATGTRLRSLPMVPDGLKPGKTG